MSDVAEASTDLSRLRALAEGALEAARAAGADAADAVAVAGTSLSVTVRNGVVEEAESAEGTDIGLRVFVGQRTALVGLGPAADLGEAAGRAVAMAKVAPEDDTVGLAAADDLATDVDPAALDLADDAAPDMDALTERAHGLERAMRRVPGVTNSGGASVSAVRGGRWFAATNGFSAGYLSSRHGHGVTAVAGEGTRMERDAWSSARRHLSDLMPVAEVGDIAAHRAVRRLGSERLTTRTATIVFEPRAAAGFVSHLLSAVNGSAVARRASLLAGKRGERVFPEGITVRDDPFVVRGVASRPFDGEGLKGAAMDIVSDGVLAEWILDLATGRKLGLPSNARAGRSTGLPSPSSTNIAVIGGSGTMESLMADAGTGLLVTDLIGMGANIVNGSYSRGCAGFWFEHGEPKHPVSEITIAGNLADMFARARFADDAPGLFTVDAPAIAIDGMTIGGA
jgi:PmbA protein